MSIHLGKNSPILKEIKNLIKKNKESYIIVEDLNSLILTLDFNKKIDYFIYSDNIFYHEDTKKIIDKAAFVSLHSYSVDSSSLNGLIQKDNSIGFIALLPLETPDIDTFFNKDFLVVCDSLEIPGNLGTIYRTADSAKVDGILLVDSITKGDNPKLVLSSRGTNIIIPTLSLDYKTAIDLLQKNNYTIYLGEPLLGKDYQSYDYDGKIAIVVGNERFGINKDWYNHAHQKVFIPMEGHNNSLNVGVAASILIYEAYMKKRTLHK